MGKFELERRIDLLEKTVAVLGDSVTVLMREQSKLIKFIDHTHHTITLIEHDNVRLLVHTPYESVPENG